MSINVKFSLVCFAFVHWTLCKVRVLSTALKNPIRTSNAPSGSTTALAQGFHVWCAACMARSSWKTSQNELSSRKTDSGKPADRTWFGWGPLTRRTPHKSPCFTAYSHQTQHRTTDRMWTAAVLWNSTGGQTALSSQGPSYKKVQITARCSLARPSPSDTYSSDTQGITAIYKLALTVNNFTCCFKLRVWRENYRPRTMKPDIEVQNYWFDQ